MVDVDTFITRITNDSCSKAQFKNTALKLCEEVELLREVARQARFVMAALEDHGASIVPHLLDTDDNAGQYLRDALEALEEVE
jgi:hypothetical protein